MKSHSLAKERMLLRALLPALCAQFFNTEDTGCNNGRMEEIGVQEHRHESMIWHGIAW